MVHKIQKRQHTDFSGSHSATYKSRRAQVLHQIPRLMSELAHIFERLELLQYLDNFIEEGFDTWETVLYITESDLDALNVKLGHRRRLQLEIAHARGIQFEQLLTQNNRAAVALAASAAEPSRGEIGTSEVRAPAALGSTKRKYRRHPKPDEHAPERPPSAYVIFSNEVREELKPRKLSFTEIAKTVGERWQSLPPVQKDPYERRAALSKETFNQAMADYRKTENYRDYMKYLGDFKAKNAPNSGDGKRPRVEKDLSRGSSTSTGSPMEVLDSPKMYPTRQFGPPSAHSASPPSSSVTPVMPTYSPSASSPTMGAPLPPPPPRPQLPRIVPMEPRDPGTRRTIGGPTASLLRHDTSRSSVSSNISGASTTPSSTYTPITPIDESRQRYQLPRQPSPLLDRGFALPPLSQSASQENVSTQMQPQSPQFGGPPPLKRLSLTDEDPNDRPTQRPRSNPPLESLADRQPRPPLPPSQPRSQDRLDALSVLALAGNMMDRRAPNQGRGRGQDPGQDRDQDRDRPWSP